MKDHPSSHHNQTKQGDSLLRKLYHHPASFVARLIFTYVILLVVSYALGYQQGLSFRRDLSGFVISQWASNPVQHQLLVAQCAKPVPPELVRQKIVNLVYNGMAPYETFTKGRISSRRSRRIEGSRLYGDIYRSLVYQLRPKTIIKLHPFMSTSAVYMANVTRELGLETQILTLVELHAHSRSRDLLENIATSKGDMTNINWFKQYVISQHATTSILPVPLSATAAVEKLCEWGIYGDLIEVNMGLDFHSVWSNIDGAYKVLRPGGVLFGHSYFTPYNKGTRQAVELFARINSFRVKSYERHWIIETA